jgi:arylsulfatase A-like enzyme
MNAITRRCCLAIAVFLLPGALVAADSRPNIVFVIADDLGYGDIGAFGQTKIRTPNIDQFAKEGMRLIRCYAGNAVCAPSRCVLMTGMHPGHAQVRNNREVQPEGQHPLLAGTATLPRLLQQLGYVTGGFGKWGLGGPESDGRPLKQGIDRWFGYNCQRVAHNHYPTYLWDNEQRLPLKNPEFSAHQKFPEGADPNDPKSYAGYTGQEYGMDVITAQAVKFIKDNKDRPFFCYFPSIIPHLALQVPADSLAEYEGAFADQPFTSGNYLPHRTPRAAYAAMVTRLDKHVGQLRQAVRECGLDDRTIYIFTSDNGPLWGNYGGTDSDFFNSASGLRGRKGSLYEGGVREPTIVCWHGHIAPGTASDRVCGFEDWLPTLLELAGRKDTTPKTIDGISFAPTLLGQSQPPRPFLYREFAPGGGQQSIYVGDWKGIRQGMLPAAAKGKGGKGGKGKAAGQPNRHIELYNLKTDPNETTDVSAQHPEIIAQMEKLLREQHTPNPEFPFAAID